MRFVLVLLASLVATEASAEFQAVAERLPDGKVSITLPRPPGNCDYHMVTVSYGTETDIEPSQTEANVWLADTERPNGVIAGIFCTPNSCTPFESEWILADEIVQANRSSFFAAMEITGLCVGLIGASIIIYRQFILRVG